MKKPLLFLVLLNLFFGHVAYAQFQASEKRVNKNKISEKIVVYVEKNYKESTVKYYKLTTEKDAIFYEAKIKLNEDQVTLVFRENGEFIGEHNKVHYLDVAEDIRVLIKSYLKDKFSSYEVKGCRYQELEDQNIYELDVTANKKNYKFRFENDGTFIDFKEARQKPIDLIFN